MRRNETPQLHTHARQPARHPNNPDQQAIKRHHVDGSETRRNSQGKRSEAHAHVVGHDGAGGQGFNAHNRVRPHFVPVNRLHHLRSQKLYLEIGILIGQDGANDACDQKDQHAQQAMFQISPKHRRVGTPEKRKYCRGARPAAGIDGIVSAHEQLVHVAGKVHGATVFANGGKVRCRLAIQKTEFLQVGAGERLQAAFRTLLQQRFQLAPIWFAFLQPAGRNHRGLV
jgi:hypothetical protein